MRICFIGDSIVNGTGDPEQLGWSGRLCRAAAFGGVDITNYNLGIRRNTSADVLARWEAESEIRLTDEEPVGLVFSFGVNDCCEENGLPRVSHGKCLENAEVILGKAMSRCPVLFVGPPPIADDPCNQRIERLSRALDALCTRIGVPSIMIYEYLIDTPVWLDEAAANDGAHPVAAGYEALYQYLSEQPEWSRFLGQIR